MSFSGRHLTLTMWMAVVLTYLNVWLGDVEVVRQYLDKGDAKSTSGLRHHAIKCWGAETVESADGTKDLEAARTILLKSKLLDGTIMAEFEHIRKGKVTYSHHQHTSNEAR
jgi:hypothetical protein